jgi:HPr kinase/phosphorylase
MPKLKLTVEQLLDRRGSFLDLRLLAGRGGLKREITEPRVQKQGLILVGVVSSVRAGRIQVLGQTELDYMSELDAEGMGLACRSLAQSAAAALLISSGLPCPETLALACEEASMPVIGSRQMSSEVIYAVQERMAESLAPRTSIHGVFVDILGQGVLLLGKSGIGKSECALSLLARGHRLIADDVVEILQAGTSVIGRGVELMRHLLEIRGLGIVDVKELYGIAAVRDVKRVDMVVELAAWREGMQVDRLGLDQQYYTLLNVELPYVVIPVRPGRDLATMIEVAARNQLLRAGQIHSSQDFSQRLSRQVERNYLRNLGEGDKR